MSNHSVLPIAPRRHPLTLALYAAVLMLPAGVAFAQDTAKEATAPADDQSQVTQLETIKVTAQKREQQIQEVPIAISAYSGDFLQKNGMDNYQSLGTLVPGLEIQMQSVANPSLSIRGITADLDDPTQEPRISVFQDGVSMSRSRGSFATPFDMQRVEILRGPQGTLFGRAAEIGALHFIQNKARADTASGFDFGVGNFSERKFSGFYNGSFSDNVFGRIAVYYDKRDGYVDNQSGGTLQGVDTQAIRGSLHFNIGDSNGLDLILNHERDTPPGTAFRSMVIPNRNATPQDIALTNTWLTSNGTVGLPDIRDGSLDPYTADAQRGDGLGTNRTLDSATILGRFRISDSWSLHTTTGWRHFDSLEKFDADGSRADLVEFNEKATGRQFSQEFRFNYDNGGNFTGFIGLDYTSETSLRDLTFQTDERQLYALLSFQAHKLAPAFLPIVPLLNPDGTPNTSVASLLGLTLNPDHHETFGNDVDVRSTELFADGTWQLNDKWELTLGLRGTHEDATYGYHSDLGNASSIGKFFSGRTNPLTGAFIPSCPTFPLSAPCFNLLFPATNGRLSDSGSWNSAVGRAVLRYKFNDNVNAYASFSRGRRPSMLQVADPNPSNPTGSKEIPAEIVNSYEVGLKGTTGGQRLAYDLAAYYYDYDNFQAQVLDPSVGPIPVDVNGGRAHADGIEASLFARLSAHTTGFLNVGLSEGGFNGVGQDGRPQALAGNTFRLFPKQKLAIGLDWTHPLSGDREFFLRPNFTYQSKVFFQDENNPSAFGTQHALAGQIQQSGYGLFNLRGGVNFGREWTLTLSVDNAFDKHYLIDAGNTGLNFGIPTLIPGASRTFGVSLDGRF